MKISGVNFTNIASNVKNGLDRVGTGITDGYKAAKVKADTFVSSHEKAEKAVETVSNTAKTVSKKFVEIKDKLAEKTVVKEATGKINSAAERIKQSSVGTTVTNATNTAKEFAGKNKKSILGGAAIAACVAVAIVAVKGIVDKIKEVKEDK